MSGLARTNDFLLTSATLMVGPQAKAFDLNEAEHSLGLVKNVQVSAEQSFVDLPQGTQGLVVASVNTQNTVRISAEVYEYTARNLAYGAGLDGSDTAYNPITETYELGTAIVGGANNVSLPLAAGDGTAFAAGDWVVLAEEGTDKTYVDRKSVV